MVLDWLKSTTRPAGPASLQDLISRKQYTRAIEVLRGQMQGRAPSVQMRLQLTDVLILAGRGPEAIPILFGLADEFAADGWVAKAVAALKRVEKIDPGREDTQDRLAQLVGRQSGMHRVVRPTYAGPGPAGSMPMPEIGIEEVGDGAEPAAHGHELEIAPPRAPSTPTGLSEEAFVSRLHGLLERFLARPAPEEVATAALAPEVLRGLEAEDVEALLRGLRLATLDPGEAIGFAGFFVVVRGRVRAGDLEREEGASFFLAPGSAAEAATDCELLYVDDAGREQLRSERPALAAALDGPGSA
jgi:hypothetical protein